MLPPSAHRRRGEPGVLGEADDLVDPAGGAKLAHAFRGGEPRLFRIGGPEGVREGDQLAFVPRRDRDEPVAAPVDPRGGIRRVDVSVPRAVFSRQPGVRPRPVQRADHRLGLRKVDHLPFAGLPARREGREDGGGRHQRRGVVPDPEPGLHRRLVRKSRDGGEPGNGLRGGVVRCPARRVRPPLPEPRVGGVDDPGISLPKLEVPDAPRVHRAGAEVLHDDVGSFREPQEKLLPLGRVQVEPDVELVAVQGEEGRRHLFPEKTLGRDVPHQVAAGRHLDLDHLGAEEAEVVRGGRPEDPRRHLEDAHPGERFGFPRDRRGVEGARGEGPGTPGVRRQDIFP
jgi:hypothetical protein